MDNVKGVLDIQGADFSSIRLLMNLSTAAGITNFMSTETPEEIQAAFVNLKEIGRRGIKLLVENRGQPQPSPMGSPTGSNMAILREFARAKTSQQLKAAMTKTIALTGNKTQADTLREIFSRLSWSFPETIKDWQKAYSSTAPIGAIKDKGLHKDVYESEDQSLLEAGVYQNIGWLIAFERGSSNELPLGPLANLVLAGPNTTGSSEPWSINKFRDLVYSTHNTSTGATPVQVGQYLGARITVPPSVHKVIFNLPPPKQAEVDEAGGLFPYVLNEENYWNMSVHDLTRLLRISPEEQAYEERLVADITGFRPKPTRYPELNYNQIGEIVLSHFDLTHPALKNLEVERVVNEVIMSARKHAFMKKKIIEEQEDTPLGFDILHKTTHYAMTGKLPPLPRSLDPKMDLRIRDLVVETIYRLTPEDAGERIDGKLVPLPLGFTRGDMGVSVIPTIEPSKERRILEKYHSRWGHEPDQPLHIYGGADNPIRLDVMELPTNGEPIRIELNGRPVPWLRFRIRSKKNKDNPKAILMDSDNIIGSDGSTDK
jgi:hypothetical protein